MKLKNNKGIFFSIRQIVTILQSRDSDHPDGSMDCSSLWEEKPGGRFKMKNTHTLKNFILDNICCEN